MGKKKFIIPMVAFGVMMPAMFMISACGKSGTPDDDTPKTPAHVHTYSEDWLNDETNHWHVCTGENCDETTGLAVHVYDDNEDSTCNICDYTRTQTTLAFKTGTYAVTYNGVAQAFDKANLVNSNVSLDDVKVEYSTTKEEDSWTETAPKDAGKYYIRLSVESNASRIGHTIISEESQALTINKKELNLAELKWVYAKAQLTAGRHSVKLTHEDISGIYDSDEIGVELNISSGSSITEGEEWVIKDQKDTTHTTKCLTVSITDDNNYNNKNYTLNTVNGAGKLLVAKDMSKTESSPYTYTKTETITKDQVVYYAAKLTRSNRRSADGAFGDEYSISLTTGVEIVDVIINNDEDICVTINADGSVIMYGEEDTPTIIFAVKYTGEEDSISNTLTLTENTITRTISTDLDFQKAFTLQNGGGYKVVTKKNGVLLEEHKHQAFTGYTNYYQNYAGTEMYYTLIDGEDNYYIFEKNASSKWERREVDVDANYADLDEVKVEFLKDSFAWIDDINVKGAFGSFEFSEEDLMYHTATRYNLNDSVMTTHIALKFETGRLVYVEFTDGTDKYTVEVTNSADGVVVNLPISGLHKDDATSFSYSDDKFSLENVTLFKGDNWFEINVLDSHSKVTGEDYYLLNGKFELTDSSSTTFTISETGVTNSANTGIGGDKGAMRYKISSTGKYYININVDADCTGSFSLQFLTKDVSGTSK